MVNATRHLCPYWQGSDLPGGLLGSIFNKNSALGPLTSVLQFASLCVPAEIGAKAATGGGPKVMHRSFPVTPASACLRIEARCAWANSDVFTFLRPSIMARGHGFTRAMDGTGPGRIHRICLDRHVSPIRPERHATASAANQRSAAPGRGRS